MKIVLNIVLGIILLLNLIFIVLAIGQLMDTSVGTLYVLWRPILGSLICIILLFLVNRKRN